MSRSPKDKESTASAKHMVPSQGYFLYDLQLNSAFWQDAALPERLRTKPQPPSGYALSAIAQAAHRLETPASSGDLALLSALNAALAQIGKHHLKEKRAHIRDDVLVCRGRHLRLDSLADTLEGFVLHFPPAAVLTGECDGANFFTASATENRKDAALAQLFVLAAQIDNRALGPLRALIDDGALQGRSGYRRLLEQVDTFIAPGEAPGRSGRTLSELLREPMRHAPDDLRAQLAYVSDHWGALLPEELQTRLLGSIDVSSQERQIRGAGPGPAHPPEFTEHGHGQPRRYSIDADWMPNVVLMAKSIHVWLDQLSKKYRRQLRRLDEIPDAELDRLARWNISGLWLIGIWERSGASKRIKQMRGNREAEASAYSLYDYVICSELGGDAALENLNERCRRRGIRLACDMVPNHTGICSRWIVEHPDWYIQTDLPPYPGYRFSGPDLCDDDEVSVVIEDGYWDHTDAAVVFKHVDQRTGTERYIYHGNDGTHLPWNDTAQLNFLLPEVRDAVLEQIVAIAKRFSIIRFDAAMTLTKKHFQRLWYPQPGGGAGVPSRSDFWMSRQDFERAFPEEFWRQVVDRIAVEAPGTLLLAEAFWLMEGFFVRTLGMHRVYNSAFMNMLKAEENARYRGVLKNILEFDPEILKRFVNFMSNPDEETAIAQFGTGDKYFGVAILMLTLPGLPMFAHGQVEGLREKYGMEYPRAYWDEKVDEALLQHHETMLFPLLARRPLFSEAKHFTLYDFQTDGGVNEDVFAYSNRLGPERTLVVYHNRFARTAGAVRTACASKPAGSDDLVTATLSSALELGDGETIWRFRDHCTGLTYLRSARQLRRQGLLLDLGPYQAHVFVDFEALDDPEGDWRSLCQSLEGRPVADPDREKRLLRYLPLHTKLAGALDAMGAPAKLGRGDLDPLSQELGALSGRRIDAGALLPDLRRDLERLPADTPSRSASVAAPLVLLHHLGLDSQQFERYLLEDPLQDWLIRQGTGLETQEQQRAVALVRCLLQWIKLLQQQAPPAAMAELLAQAPVRQLIGVNSHEGHLWFHKESTELLLDGMTMAGHLFHPPAEADALARQFEQWRTASNASGYRLDKFLDLL